mmetsp:Transcript_5687/g.8013  ORF Transcript_5687/g.8013 Transcript_5687/m.8013 type:complete len:159 (-) Transcript_5687:304-780(-)
MVGARTRTLCVYHCAGCREILGDSLTLTISDTENRRLALKRATSVEVSVQQVKIVKGGVEDGAAYNDLTCKRCSLNVGKMYLKLPTEVELLKGLYSLDLDAIQIYRLGDASREGGEGHLLDQDNMITALQMVVLALDKRISKLEGGRAAKKQKTGEKN